MWGGVTYITNGNEKLKPEESKSYEFGLNHQFNPYLSGYMTHYKMKVKNLIALDSKFDTTNNVSTSTYMNIDTARFKGYEIGFKAKYKELFLNAEYAYTKSKNESNQLEIAYRPKETLTLKTGVENSIYGLSASLVARSKMNYSNSKNPGQVAGYTTIDVDGYWNISPNIKLFTNIQNIGDVEYKEVWNFGNWYISGGRQANIGITLKY